MSYPLSPINTVLLPEFQAWTDEFGLVQDNDQEITTGNGILYTAHYLVGLKEKGLLTVQEQDRVMAVFHSCEVLPGVFKRAPARKDGDYQAHDDPIGIMGAEGKLFPNRKDRLLSQSIFEYGNNIRAEELDSTEQNPSKQAQNKWALWAIKLLQIPRKYVWNNKNPGKFHVNAWLGLRIDVIATMKLATGKAICPLQWLYWAFYMLSVKKGSSHDSFILRYHMILAAEGYGPLTDMVCKKTRAKIFEVFPDFGQLLSEYFNKPQHPLVKLLENVK